MISLAHHSEISSIPAHMLIIHDVCVMINNNRASIELMMMVITAAVTEA